jgi:hypothetical protein
MCPPGISIQIMLYNYDIALSVYIYVGLILFCTAIIVYHMNRVLMENHQLRNRNYELATTLQTAELQTGSPYYSSTLRNLVSEKSNGAYYESLESQVYAAPHAVLRRR